MTVNCNVAPVTNFLGEVGGVEDEFGFKVGVAAVLCQKAQIQREIKVRHGFVEEASMAGFIARHQGKALRQQGVAILELAAQFFVEEKARKFRCAGAFQKFNKQLASFAINVIPRLFKFCIPHKVMAVVVAAEFLEDGLKFCFVFRNVHIGHRFKVSGVEAGREDGFLGRGFDARPQFFKLRFGDGINHKKAASRSC